MTEVYRAFNQMAEDVEQAGRERELMLAGVSHDLRTPLTRLRLSLELMASDDELTEDMIRDVEDMNAILDQFLAFVRDGSDEPVETTDLASLIREVVAPITSSGNRAPVRRADAAVRPASGVDQTPAGEPDRERPALRRWWRRSGCLCLRRPACALRGAQRAGPWPGSIRPSWKASSIRSFAAIVPVAEQGAGLGLAIVKRIASQHGGVVELRNREGGGLEARVSLPLGLLLPRDAVQGKPAE